MEQTKMPTIEKRGFEIRTELDKEEKRFSGYAAVYNQESEDFGGFREVIAPGAFAGVLDSDIRMLYNHDKNLVLGRTSSGTLRLSDDGTGIRFDVMLGDQSYARDALITVERGDVNQASFGFTVDRKDVEWDKREGKPVRIIKRIKRLLELSVVTFPAYPQTEVAVREYRAYVDQTQEARAFQAQLFKFKTMMTWNH